MNSEYCGNIFRALGQGKGGRKENFGPYVEDLRITLATVIDLT